MKSIREIYKIGKGPSSSHTMGPEKAAKLIRAEYPEADAFRIILYGSLSKTGEGHGTDRVIRDTLAPAPAEIVFNYDDSIELPHPNTLDLFALKNGEQIGSMRVMSIGGGDIRVDGNEGDLEWLDKSRVLALPMWEGDRIFLRLLDEDAPFFDLILEYQGDRLVRAVLNGETLPVRQEET